MPLPRRHYRHPPLVNAVAEFRFAPGAWDQTVPGLFYAQVQDTFPSKEQVPVIEMATLADEGGQVQQQITNFERLLLRRTEGDATIAIGSHYLAITRAAPYESWEEFQPLIALALAAYREVAAPEGIQRIGLRYVNRVAIDLEARIELGDYFDFFPHVGEHLPQDHGSFICGVQIPFEGDRDLVRVQLADQPPGEFVLDIDYFLNRVGHVSFEVVEEWLTTAHGHVEQVFEGCIKDSLRKMFGVVD